MNLHLVAIRRDGRRALVETFWSAGERQKRAEEILRESRVHAYILLQEREPKRMRATHKVYMRNGQIWTEEVDLTKKVERWRQPKARSSALAGPC